MITPDYPVKYIKTFVLSDGTVVILRPVHPYDAKQAKVFRKSLSDDTLMSRFLGFIPKVTKRLVSQLVNIDYNSEMAIVAEIERTKSKKIIGVGRIAKEITFPDTVELAVIVADKWQGKKLGFELIEYMIFIAKDMKYKKINAVTFSSNKNVIKILEDKGFTQIQEKDGTIRAYLDL